MVQAIIATTQGFNRFKNQEQCHEFESEGILVNGQWRMVNASLAQGRLPPSERHAIVTPLLKKPGLDVSDMSSYEPVSNLSFMSKVVERAVTAQLNDYLLTNNLMPRYQSAYRKKHPTETALLRVWSDTLNA